MYTHVVGPTSNVILVFLHLQLEFLTLGLSVQLVKCVAWSPQGLNHSISLPPDFLIPNLGFHVLGTPMGSRSFVEPFMHKALHEDLGTICSFWDAFVVLSPMPSLFVSYNISILKYFVALH
jgi:hypothetical protein